MKKKPTNKYLALIFLVINAFSFSLSGMNLTNNYVSFNNLISLIFANVLNLKSYSLSSVIFIPIITIAFYGLLFLLNIS